jgi:hypothetical protein
VKRAKASPSTPKRTAGKNANVKAVEPSRMDARLGLAAVVAVGLAAFAFAFHKLDDFDTWWHLASGRWIAVHRSIPSADTLSHTVRDHAWINLQWAFDLAMYLLYRVGGPALLCTAGAAAFVSAVALLLRLTMRQAGAGLGALVMLLAVIAAQERVTLRPELISFLLLASVLSVLEYARRHEGRAAWLLVPLMIVWVNVHALFVIGAFAIVCALVSDFRPPPRGLIVASLAALASVIVNPYGLTGVLFPWKLVSRINGSNPVFRTIGEFGSPFAEGATGTSVLFYKIVLGVGCVAGVAALLATLRSKTRNFDWGGALFFAGLAAVSIAARRNIALFALGSAPFIAHCIGTLVARARSGRWVPIVSAATAVAAVLLAAAVATGAFYRYDNQPQEFGAGVIEGTFPIRAAAFARAAALPRAMYNDMGAGGYLAWDDPIGDGVFVDGRLEVYDADFLTEYVKAVADPARWQADADRGGIQTAIIFHRFENDRVLAGQIFRNGAWTLVYSDEVAAIFVRTAGNDAALARAAALRPAWDARTDAWLARPAAKWPYPAGRIEGTRALARFRATVGLLEPAVAAYLKLVELGIPSSEEIEDRLLLARYFAKTGRIDRAREQALRILAIDPGQAEARRLVG